MRKREAERSNEALDAAVVTSSIRQVTRDQEELGLTESGPGRRWILLSFADDKRGSC